MNKRTTYKYCIVPCCTSTTAKTKEKIFFHVPNDRVKRQAWINAMKRDDKHKLSCTSTLWCCEDHFLLPHDMENFWQWKLMKDVKRIQLKRDVIPHIFDCQKKKAIPDERPPAKKRKFPKEQLSKEVEPDVHAHFPKFSSIKSTLYRLRSSVQQKSPATEDDQQNRNAVPVLEFVGFDALDNSPTNDSPLTPQEINAHDIKIEVIEEEENKFELMPENQLELVPENQLESIQENNLELNSKLKTILTKRKRTPETQLQETEPHVDETSRSDDVSRSDEDDECELYGKLMAKKLRKLPEAQRERLMYEIQGLFVKASQS